jgi:hypothetical protein
MSDIDAVTGAWRVVEDLSPQPIPAPCVGPPFAFTCEGCGYDGYAASFFIYDGLFVPICNCPLPATLTA